MIWDRLDLVCGLQHPALAPDIDDALFSGRVADEGERDLENDRVDVLAGLRVLAAIDEAVIAVGILRESVALPDPGTRRQLLLDAMSQHRVLRIEIEEIVSFELEKGLRDRQLARFGQRVRHVIELRRVIDRAKEAGEIVEEGIVPPADEELDRVSARRLHCGTGIDINRRGEAAAGKIEQAHGCVALAVGRHPDLAGPYGSEILLFQRVEIGDETLEALILLRRMPDAPTRRDLDAVQH